MSNKRRAKPLCIMAACDNPAKYWVEMTRTCGCYHESHSTPRMTCIECTFRIREMNGIASRATECRQCGDVNYIKLLSVKSIIWPKLEEEAA